MRQFSIDAKKNRFRHLANVLYASTLMFSLSQYLLSRNCLGGETSILECGTEFDFRYRAIADDWNIQLNPVIKDPRVMEIRL